MKEKENKIVIQAADETVVAAGTGSISVSERNEEFFATKATNHNEILLMEKDWEEIKRKTKLIKIHKHIPIVGAIGGAAVSYGIEVVRSLMNKEAPDYTAFVVSILLLMVACVLAKYIPCFSGSNNETNKVHLEDLLQLEDRIDKDKTRHRSS